MEDGDRLLTFIARSGKGDADTRLREFMRHAISRDQAAGRPGSTSHREKLWRSGADDREAMQSTYGEVIGGRHRGATTRRLHEGRSRKLQPREHEASIKATSAPEHATKPFRDRLPEILDLDGSRGRAGPSSGTTSSSVTHPLRIDPEFASSVSIDPQPSGIERRDLVLGRRRSCAASGSPARRHLEAGRGRLLLGPLVRLNGEGNASR
jgi:hypothetical protein